MDWRLDYGIAGCGLAATCGWYAGTLLSVVSRCEVKIGSLVEGPEAEQSAGNRARREQIRRIKSDKVAFRRINYFFADIGGLMGQGHDPKHAVSSLRNGARSASVQVADFWPITTIVQHFSRFFIPFLRHKQLVSRRLWNNHGLIESRQAKPAPILKREKNSKPEGS